MKNEIDRLRAEIDLIAYERDSARAVIYRLRLALQTIRDQGGDVVEPWSAEIARRALEDRR